MREDLKVAYLNEIFGPDSDKETMQIMLRTLEVQCNWDHLMQPILSLLLIISSSQPTSRLLSKTTDCLVRSGAAWWRQITGTCYNSRTGERK